MRRGTPTASSPVFFVSTPTKARPPATITPTPPPAHHVDSGLVLSLDQPVDTFYNPGEPPEQVTFSVDRPVRVAVAIEALDGGVDLRLQARLYDSAGNLLLPVSASLGQPLLRGEWDLPEAGEYAVQLFGPETTARAFRLAVVSRPVPEIGGGTIRYGETHSGEIAVRGQRDQWVFRGRTGDRVLITMTALLADGYLELYAPDERLLASNDDGPASNDPVLELDLPADGPYTIVVRMYDDDQTGVYQLALDRR